jgi:hypothetical protein
LIVERAEAVTVVNGRASGGQGNGIGKTAVILQFGRI